VGPMSKYDNTIVIVSHTPWVHLDKTNYRNLHASFFSSILCYVVHSDEFISAK
jgi:hypothetical protein